MNFRTLILTASVIPVTMAQGPSPSPSPTPVPTPPPTLRETVNTLDPEQIRKAIEAIGTHFILPDALDETSRQRALLEGVVRRLSPGVTIVSENATQPASASHPLLVEILDERTGYLRPGTLDAGNLAQIDAALANFTERGLPAVILDLRALPAGSEFDAAADLARRFCPQGKILFTIQRPSARQERILTVDQEPTFRGLLIVLTDSDTSGAAEVLAATLRLHAGAMVVGADTAGEAVEFASFSIGGGRAVRVAVTQAILPDGRTVFPQGVKPDVAVALSPAAQEEIFSRSREGGVSQFVFDTERARMNEAALVANTNPEIEPTVARAERAAPPLRDTVLQRAVDLVTAISFFKDRR
ncbi:MAG: S41 family peptidase [Terrimicrobiaceae bacterium]|nr:S41 family peptidase [Terrimicrobiaceae bacterium]